MCACASIRFLPSVKLSAMSAYKPQNLGKVLEIFRVFYNYCSAGQDKQTPAMRMGLAKGPVKLEEVLCYVE